MRESQINQRSGQKSFGPEDVRRTLKEKAMKESSLGAKNIAQINAMFALIVWFVVLLKK